MSSTGAIYKPPTPNNPINKIFNPQDYNQGSAYLTQDDADNLYPEYNSPAWFTQLAVQNNGAFGGNVGVCGNMLVGGTTQSTNVSTTHLKVNGIQWRYPYAGCLYLSTGVSLPLFKSIADTTQCYTGFDLKTALGDLPLGILLLPQYSIRFLDIELQPLGIVDNTGDATDILYVQYTDLLTNCASVVLTYGATYTIIQ